MKDHKFYSRISHSLAVKYNDPDEYEELYSIGILTAYQYGHKETRQIISHMRKAMNDYYNLQRGSISLPVGSNSRKMARKLREGSPENTTEDSFNKVFTGSYEPVEPNTLKSEDSSEEIIIRKDLRDKLEGFLNTTKRLTRKEKETLRMLYLEDNTEADVGRALRLSRSRVNKNKHNGIIAFKKHLKVRL